MRVLSWLLCLFGIHDWDVERRAQNVGSIDIYERCRACDRGRIREVRWKSPDYHREGGRRFGG